MADARPLSRPETAAWQAAEQDPQNWVRALRSAPGDRDAARARLVTNITGHLLEGVTEPVLQRAFQYWRNVDKSLGDKIESAVRASEA